MAEGVRQTHSLFQYRVSRWNQLHPRFELKMVQVDQPKMLGVIWSTAAKGLCLRKLPQSQKLSVFPKDKCCYVAQAAGGWGSVHHHHRHSVNKQEFAFT